MDTIQWEKDTLILLDQTKLPLEEAYLNCTTWQDVRDAISVLAVRGAPAIGVAAAYGFVLAAKYIYQNQPDITKNEFSAHLTNAAKGLCAARPTAVNLAWAVNKMLDCTHELLPTGLSIEAIIDQLEEMAIAINQEDIRINKAISSYGAEELSQGKPLTILTHCNAGALATAGIGTALGVIRELHKRRELHMVYADETRPLLQGARLTTYELMADHIPVTLITDNMAAWTIKTKEVNAIIVGADRITCNGDTANKIGTFGISLIAKELHIPFYIAAPVSTFDFTLEQGSEIPIEERQHDEVRSFYGTATALPDTPVFNPAFDVTPHENITGIITEYGIIAHPDRDTIITFFKEKGVM